MPYIGRGSDFGVRTVFHFLATNGQTSVSGSDADSKALSFSDGNEDNCSKNIVIWKDSGDTSLSNEIFLKVSKKSWNLSSGSKKVNCLINLLTKSINWFHEKQESIFSSAKIFFIFVIISGII